MKTLFRLALFSSKHQILLWLTAGAMIVLTLASQLEIVALGVMTKKGPDLFEVFAPIKEGRLVPQEHISWAQVEGRWKEMDIHNTGEITAQETTAFVVAHKGMNLVDRVTLFLDTYFHFKTHVETLALFIVLVAFFKAIALFWQRFCAKLVAIRVSRDLRQAYFEHIQSLPMDFYQKHQIGSLSSRVVGDAALVAEALNACLVNYLQTPFTVVSTLVLCFLTSWQLSLIIFFGLPAIFFPVAFLAKRVKKISRQIQKNQELFASVLVEFLSGIQTVKLFAMETFSLRKYSEQNQKMAALEQKSARYDLSSRPIVHTLGMFFLASALLYGLYGLHMNVADVLVYCGLLYVFYEPIKKFAEENTHIQRGISAAERMQEVLDCHPAIQDGVEAIPFVGLEKEMEFRGVSFRYGVDWILQDISFTVHKGETVAIVGPTGCGKSTLVQLIPRLYEIEKGEILLDGRPLSSYTQRSLREGIAFVPQKPFLFCDTIAENIAFGRPFSQKEIEKAAKMAHAEEFIQKLPQKYATEVLEAGKSLSGGQQQRLAIARALIKQASILVLDEATSALDALSEEQIKMALRELKGSMTMLVIAHRLTTIEDADRILYLENGRKLAEGSKEELLASCPAFRSMWETMVRQNSRNMHV